MKMRTCFSIAILMFLSCLVPPAANSGTIQTSFSGQVLQRKRDICLDRKCPFHEIYEEAYTELKGRKVNLGAHTRYMIEIRQKWNGWAEWYEIDPRVRYNVGRWDNGRFGGLHTTQYIRWAERIKE